METNPSTVAGSRAPKSSVIPWESLEERTPTAFALAGVSLVASALVPAGLQTVTGWAWAWASGIALAGAAVFAAAAGLFGLYPTVSERAPRLATAGALGAAVAGGAALGLIAMGGIALVGEGAFGMDLGKPVGVFVALALTVAGGFSLGFLSVGTAGLRTGTTTRTTGALLLLGGAVLLVPIVGEVLRRGFGIEAGVPPWIFLPALGAVALDTLALGYWLRTRS